MVFVWLADMKLWGGRRGKEDMIILQCLMKGGDDLIDMIQCSRVLFQCVDIFVLQTGRQTSC